MIPYSRMQYILHKSCNILFLVILMFAQSRHYKQLVSGVIIVYWFIAMPASCGVIRPSPFKLIFIVSVFACIIIYNSVRLLNS